MGILDKEQESLFNIIKQKDSELTNVNNDIITYSSQLETLKSTYSKLQEEIKDNPTLLNELKHHEVEENKQIDQLKQQIESLKRQ